MARREVRSTRQSLGNKFRFAWRGLRRGVRSESNFFVHLFMAVMVVAVAAVLGCTLVEWSLLALCIGSVLTAEMFNTALEHLVKDISDKRTPFLADALDMASAAVLLTAVASAVVGTLILGRRLGILLNWWSG